MVHTGTMNENNRTQEEKDNLNLSIIWMRNSTEVGTGESFFEEAWNCEGNQTADFGLTLCNHTGFIGPWIISAIISDDVQDIYVTWYISYEVWHPPEPVIEEKDDDAEAKSSLDISKTQMTYIGFGIVITILLTILIFRGNKPPKAQQSTFIDPRYQPMENQYSAVPSAPTLPPPPGAF